MIHPYGAIGDDVQFGSTHADYVAEAQHIKIYTEQIEDATIVDQIREEVLRAECIGFLRFAYHSQNMSILKPVSEMNEKHVYGTAYKMSDADVVVVQNQIAQFCKEPKNQMPYAKLENKLKSTGLFDHYARSLTGGD